MYHIKINSWIISFKLFPVIFSWWLICFFPAISNSFITALLFIFFANFLPISPWFKTPASVYQKHLSSSLKKTYCCLFGFYRIKRAYIKSTANLFMTFIMQQINTIKDKINTSCWCFQPNLIRTQNVLY